MHDHGRDTGANQRRLACALGLAACYAVAEVVGGLWTGSLALLADAGHMLSDVFALALSLVALRVAQRPASPQRTFGYLRTEILAALAQGVILVAVSVSIVVEALRRLEAPAEVLGGPMLAIAAGGLAVNLVGLAILHGGQHGNLNVRGAFLHVASDALGSVGAIAAGAAIALFGWLWADAAASLAIAALVVWSSWQLLRDALQVLMEAAPPHIDVAEVQRSIGTLPGVRDVHDLHVWTITSGLVSLSGHVVAADGARHPEILQSVSNLLHTRYGIEHATIQIEDARFEAPGAACCGG